MPDVTNYGEHWKRIYHETYASGKDFWRPELATPPEFAEFLDSPLAPRAPARVLEAGCGDGLNAVYLARKGYTVTGVDIADEAIIRAARLARECGLSIEFLCGDLVQPLGRPETYDLWVDIKTLHVLWENDERRAYLANAFESLRSGGVLFLDCGLALADVREHFPKFFAALDAEVRKGADILDRTLPRNLRGGIRCETLDWCQEELKSAGFEVLRAERVVSDESGWGMVLVARKS